MKKLFGAITIAAVVFFLALGIARTRQREEVMTIPKIQEVEGVPVLAAPAVLGDVSLFRRYYGEVYPRRQAVISAKIGDRIDKLLVKVGDRVREGQPLVQFDTTTTMASVMQLSLAAQNARLELNRARSLYEQGALSRQALDGAALASEIADQNYQTARASVVLNAPMDARVASMNVVEGQYIHGGDPLMTIIAGEGVIIEFPVTADDVSHIKPNMEIQVTSPAGATAVGRVTQVSSAANPATRQFTVYASLQEEAEIRPGVMAVIDIPLVQRDSVLIVPADALIERDGHEILVVVEGGVARVKQVQTGMRGEKNVEILAGIRIGDMVLTYGHTDLQDGAKVKIVSGL